MNTPEEQVADDACRAEPEIFTAFIAAEPDVDRGFLHYLWAEALTEHGGAPAADPQVEFSFSPAVGRTPAGWRVRGLGWR